MKFRSDHITNTGHSKFTLLAYCLVTACALTLIVIFALPDIHQTFEKQSFIRDLQDLPLGPVRFSGVVTYVDKHSGRVWIQDETGAIPLQMDAMSTPYAAGQVLLVSATKTHQYNPLLGLSSVELSDIKIISYEEHGTLPAPMASSVNNLPAQEKNGMRVVLSGVVHSAFKDPEGLTEIAIGQGRRELWLIAPRLNYDLNVLPDSTVQGTGVSETIYAADGRATGRRIWIASSDGIRIVQPASSSIPTYSIRDLYRDSKAHTGHLIALHGTIALRLGSTSWLIEDKWGAIACNTDVSQNFDIGTPVDVRGYPVTDGIRIDLNHSTIKLRAQFRPADNGKSEREEPVLRSVAAIRKLSAEQASNALPASLTGVVTFADDDWGQIFLQDSTGGIYIKYSGSTFSLSQGQRVVATGITGPGDYAPVLLAPKFRKLGDGGLPKPRQITQEQALSGGLDSQFIEVEGIIHPARNNQNPKHMSVALFSSIGQIHVELGPEFGSIDYLHKLEDARVRIRGVCGTIFNSRRQLIGIQLSVSKPENIRVLDPGDTNPFQKSSIPISKLLQFSSDMSFNRRIKVAGTVTAVGADFFYLQDKSGGIEVRTEARDITPGDFIEAVGYATATGGYSPVLTDAAIQTTGRRQPTTLRKITVAEASDGSYDSQLVTIEGRLLSTVSSLNSKTLLLESGGRAFTAELYILNSSTQPAPLENGSILRLTGICATQVNRDTAYLLLAQEPSGFKFIIRSPADIIVLRDASWWNTRHTGFVLVALVMIILAGLMALVVTRRRIRQQEVALQQAIEKTKCIRELITATQEVTTTKNFSARVSARGDDDLAQLGAEFNMMLSELEIREKQKIAAEMKLQQQALTDELTGLPNRRLLADRLAQSLARAEREQKPVAILYLDLDGFKLVNDSMGHRIGDILLAEVAERLQSRIRKADTLARLGGDEFAVILTSLNDKEDAEKVANSLLEVIVRKFEIEGHEIRISASIGISVYPENGTTATELLQQADSAMYAAKRNGKSRMFYFTAEIGSLVRERVTLENQLRGALERGEIILHYQPEFEVGGNKLVRFEALARWTHPTLGEIPPSKFIPVAEDSGLIIPLGAYVLERACMDAVEWQKHAASPIQVAVNVSSIELMHQGFVDRVAEVLRHTGLPAGLLQLELTESVMLSGTQRATDAMTRLRALGVSLAIDDFGTGYSCFGYLPQLPFNALKIDRGFVKELGSRPEMKAMVQSLITLAHNLSMQVIVEGIETPEQLEIVQDFGGNQVQGYLLGRPTPKPLDLLDAITSQANKTGSKSASAAVSGK